MDGWMGALSEVLNTPRKGCSLDPHRRLFCFSVFTLSLFVIYLLRDGYDSAERNLVDFSLLHELPVSNHDLGDALQRLGLDCWITVADHSESDLFA